MMLAATILARADVELVEVGRQYRCAGPFDENLPINPDLLDISLLREDEKVPVVRPPTDIRGIAGVIRKRGDVRVDPRIRTAASLGIEINVVIALRNMGLETALTVVAGTRVRPEG